MKWWISACNIDRHIDIVCYIATIFSYSKDIYGWLSRAAFAPSKCVRVSVCVIEKCDARKISWIILVQCDSFDALRFRYFDRFSISPAKAIYTVNTLCYFTVFEFNWNSIDIWYFFQPWIINCFRHIFQCNATVIYSSGVWNKAEYNFAILIN